MEWKELPIPERIPAISNFNNQTHDSSDRTICHGRRACETHRHQFTEPRGEHCMGPPHLPSAGVIFRYTLGQYQSTARKGILL